MGCWCHHVAPPHVPCDSFMIAFFHIVQIEHINAQEMMCSERKIIIQNVAREKCFWRRKDAVILKASTGGSNSMHMASERRAGWMEVSEAVYSCSRYRSQRKRSSLGTGPATQQQGRALCLFIAQGVRYILGKRILLLKNTLCFINCLNTSTNCGLLGKGVMR